MTLPLTSGRAFEPGTVGWTLADLADPGIAAKWEQGRYELVEGVLATLPAGPVVGSRRLFRLVSRVERNLAGNAGRGEFALAVDVVISDDRVARVDAVYLTPDDDRRQVEELERRGIAEREMVPQFAPPTLIIESLSEGHERHDRVTKRRWYAEAGVPHYWLLHTFERTLECLVLDGAAYRTDQVGRDDDEVRPGLFPGLVIPLGDIWK